MTHTLIPGDTPIMQAKKTHFATISDYIAAFPSDIQERLQQICSLVRTVAQEAEGRISYNMPSFWLNGSLLYFSAFKKHIGFYPASAAVFETFRQEMAEYKQSGRGTIQFPYSKPVPLELIRKIIVARIEENLMKGQGAR